MKALNGLSRGELIGLILGAAGLIVGLAGFLVGIYSDFFKNYRTFVLVISAIMGLLAFIIMVWAMWHFVGPSNFTKLFSKKFLCRLLERSKFIKHLRSGWVEDFCKRREILLLTPRKDTAFVKKLIDLLERENINCNFVDFTKEPGEINEDLNKKCLSHKIITVLYETIEAKNWLNAQVVKIRQLSQDRKQPCKNIVVCNTTGTRLDINLSPAQILNCSTKNLERDLQSFINQVNK